MVKKEKEITRLRKENLALREENLALREANRIFREEVKDLKERIEQLERMLKLSSSNSSKPPSSDGLRKKPSPQSLRVGGQRSSGGQNGHEGNTLKQVANPDHQLFYRIEYCDVCKKSMEISEPVCYVKRQVFDIPEPRLEVTEHLAEVRICQCGKKNHAPFPEFVTAPVQYGPRVKTLTVYLSNQQFVPENRLQQTFKDLFALNISTATITSINRNFADKIAPIQEQTLEELKKAKIKNVDEAALRIGGKTNWLHSTSSEMLTHYRVSEKRGNLLENVQGVLVHDHWKPYFTMQGVQHALCNAHHLRELKALETIEKEPWAFMMSRLLKFLILVKNAPFELVSKIYDKIVEEGIAFHLSQPKMRGRKRRPGHNLLLRLRNFKDAVLRFLTVSGVPFTNNQAEQDIRMIKVKQKISGCFRTFRGAEIFCIIRGFISTLRKQNKNIFQGILANVST